MNKNSPAVAGLLVVKIRIVVPQKAGELPCKSERQPLW